MNPSSRIQSLLRCFSRNDRRSPEGFWLLKNQNALFRIHNNTKQDHEHRSKLISITPNKGDVKKNCAGQLFKAQRF